MRWDSLTHPLPVRQTPSVGRPIEAPPWIETSRPGEPFHFSEAMRNLCADIAARYPPLKHVDVSRIIFSFTPAKNGRAHGLQAKVTPLRFGDGELTRLHRGTPFQVQQFFLDGREMLYIMTFCLPRFLNRQYEDKFVTIFHELFHIGPKFDGDLRRHEGRYSVHTASQKRYDEEMSLMAREYLRSGPDPALYSFLKLNHAQLRHRHGAVVGHVVPRPKLIPLRLMFH
jgi:hypothetical protein